MALTLDSQVVATPEQVHRTVDDEAVILHLGKSSYFGTGAVGRRIWEIVQKPVALQSVLDTLLDEYEVERARCTTDLLAFITELEQNGLVEVKS